MCAPRASFHASTSWRSPPLQYDQHTRTIAHFDPCAIARRRSLDRSSTIVVDRAIVDDTDMFASRVNARSPAPGERALTSQTSSRTSSSCEDARDDAFDDDAGARDARARDRRRSAESRASTTTRARFGDDPGNAKGQNSERRTREWTNGESPLSARAFATPTGFGRARKRARTDERESERTPVRWRETTPNVYSEELLCAPVKPNGGRRRRVNEEERTPAQTPVRTGFADAPGSGEVSGKKRSKLLCGVFKATKSTSTPRVTRGRGKAKGL